MAKVIWGIDFGNWSLKVARATYDKKTGALVVDLLDEVPYGDLPCGHDAAQIQKHREAVIAFRNRYEVGPADDLCVSVTGSEVFSRFINLPPVLDRIDEIIGYEARQQIPFDIDDVVWDYQPVKSPEDIEVGEEVEVGLFALKKERVEELMDLLEPWRRNLRVVQDAPLAVYNLLDYEGLVDEPAVVVDVGAATTDVLVLNPPRFWVRTLLVAGDGLTNALMDQFGISHEEAEKIKRRAGKSQHREQVLRVLQPVFDDLVNEVQRSLGYYKSLAREVRFTKVIAIGSALRMTGLTQMLAAGLQYQVQPLRELSRIQVAESIDSEEFEARLPGACAALGLLIQGAGLGHVSINMVPEEVAIAGEIAKKKPWLLAAAAGLLVVAGALVLGEHLYAQDISGIGDGLPWDRVDAAQQLTAETNKARNAYQQEVRKVEQMAQQGIQRDLFLKLLPLITDNIPEDVYLTELKFEWMEPKDISPDMARLSRRTGAIRRPFGGMRAPGARGPSSGMVSGGAAGREVGAAAAAAAIARATSGARRSGPMSGRGGPRSMGGPRPSGGPRPMRRGQGGAVGAAGRVTPQFDANSRLVVRFACETTKISQTFIEEEVFGGLRALQFGENLPEARSAFHEVQMLGGVQDTYRDEKTFQLVGEADPDARRYVSFEGYAVVNLGEKPTAGTGGGRAARGR